MEIEKSELNEYLKYKMKMIGCIDRICKEIQLDKRKIVLFNIPSDCNLGDHAQTVCIKELLISKFPDYQIFSIPTITQLTYEDTEAVLIRLKFLISEDDLIVFHSGYHINDIYCNKFLDIASTALVQMIIIKYFKNNKIIYFPQTINMSDEHMILYGEQVKNKDICLMCRDEVSYARACSMWEVKDILLMPDVVTTWIGRYEYSFTAKKNKKTACIALRDRNTAESIITDQEYQKIVNILLEQGYNVIRSKTTLEIEYESLEESTRYYVQDKINEFTQYDLIVTDLYHGTIFSLIANTPVFVLNSADHKIRSGVKFFKQFSEFDERIYFENKFDDLIKKLVDFSMKSNGLKSIETPYFYNEYSKVLDYIVDTLRRDAL